MKKTEYWEISTLFMQFLQCLGLLFLIFHLNGCTLSVTTIHSQGEASDLVDETVSPTTSVKASASIPAL